MLLEVRGTNHFFLVIILLCTLNTSCIYYSPDLRGGTIGSGLGALSGGFAMVGATTEVAALGGGIILGSILGSVFGATIDNHSALHLDDPTTGPIPLFYYQTVRAPIVLQQFYPAQVILPSDDKGGQHRPHTLNG